MKGGAFPLAHGWRVISAPAHFEGKSLSTDYQIERETK
jgi:hypothetical protein